MCVFVSKFFLLFSTWEEKRTNLAHKRINLSGCLLCLLHSTTFWFYLVVLPGLASSLLYSQKLFFLERKKSFWSAQGLPLLIIIIKHFSAALDYSCSIEWIVFSLYNETTATKSPHLEPPLETKLSHISNWSVYNKKPIKCRQKLKLAEDSWFSFACLSLLVWTKNII